MLSEHMRQPRLFAVGCVLFVSLIVGCSTTVQPKMIAWNDRLPVVGPPAGAGPATTSLTSLGLLEGSSSARARATYASTPTPKKFRTGVLATITFDSRSTSMGRTVN